MIPDARFPGTMLGNPEERCDDPAVPASQPGKRNQARQAQESLFKRRALRGATATALTFVAYGGKGEHSTVVVSSRVRPYPAPFVFHVEPTHHERCDR